jgi:hypothetical protein
VILYPADVERIDLDTSDLRVRASASRLVARMSGVIALCFESKAVSFRHEAHRAAGGRWHFARYRPHVSFTLDDGRDLRQMRPYSGALLFGPEIVDHGAF